MKHAPQIPDQIAQAIVDYRRHVHENCCCAVQFHFNHQTKPLVLTDELQFWKITDDDQLEDILSELSDVLRLSIENESMDWSILPRGYTTLRLVLNFEYHCLCEGFTAVSNVGVDAMSAIIQAYQEMGLHDEAKALEAVTAAYIAMKDKGEEEDEDILGDAYRSVPNQTSEDVERFPFIYAYVRNHPSLFCDPTSQQIPDQVAHSIIASRQKVHLHAEKFQERQQTENIHAPYISPVSDFLEDLMPLDLNKELQFWNITDDEELDQFLEGFEEALIDNENIDWDTLPKGYRPLLLVLNFEHHLPTQDWEVIASKGIDEMQKIIQAYREIDMADEAYALEVVTNAYAAFGNDNPRKLESILDKAYRSTPCPVIEEKDRYLKIRAYIRQNPEHFYFEQSTSN